LENRNNTGGYCIVSVRKRYSSKKGPKKIGLLKLFLDWIARGGGEGIIQRWNILSYLTDQALTAGQLGGAWKDRGKINDGRTLVRFGDRRVLVVRLIVKF